MKIFTYLCVIAFLVLTNSCSHRMHPAFNGEKKENALAVMSYNIHHANPPSRPGLIDLDAVANVINREHVDVVALQEVDVHTIRSGVSINEAEELAKLTGMKAYFAKAIDYEGGGYGLAILSKLPMENESNTPLPTDGETNGEHRTLARVTLTLPNNKKIVFACTHLDAQHKDANRQLQIKKILQVMKQETLPVIIAGDFNDTPSSDVILQLDSYFTRSCVSNCPYTIPQINPGKTIDYIAFAPAAKFNAMSHTVVDEQYASDHRPVKTVIQLK